MKINDLRTIIREEIQNELAEAKKKKKKEATEKIMEIIAEAELTEEELEEGIFDFFSSKEDPKVNELFSDDDKKIDAYLNFWGYKSKVKPEEIEAAKADKKLMGVIKSSLSALGKLIGYENISKTKFGATVKGKDGKDLKLDLATLGNNNVESPGKVWQVKTKAGGRSIGSGAYGE